MEVILNSHIARVVLAYLYDQKMKLAADEFCKASPYLKEERQLLRSGYRPAMYISFKLSDLFRDYSEIQIKLNNFVEKYGDEFSVPSDATLTKKIELLLSLVKRTRGGKIKVGPEEDAAGNKEQQRKPVGPSAGSKRKRLIPSPQPSLASSTPEVAEPRHKRICMNQSFIVLNDSGRNLSNLSHISPIVDGDTTQDSCGGADDDRESEPKEEEKDQEQDQQQEEEEVDVKKFPSIDLFSQTLLENENYSLKIADLINKGLETSMSQQQQQQLSYDPVEGTSSAGQTKEIVEQKPENQSFNFNFDELISNIVNSAVKDPVFGDMMDDISSKAVTTQNGKEISEAETTPPPETPLKERLRKTCKKNYNHTSLKKSVKKVKVISDVPYSGSIPEMVNAGQSESAATAVVQPQVSSTDDMPVSSVGTTQFYVIQPDNTTKLVDINQLQFPTQQSVSISEQSSMSQVPPTLIPISGSGIPEHTYFINIPSYYLDATSQLPVLLNTYQTGYPEQVVSSPTMSLVQDSLPSPDKFLIFPSSASSTYTSAVGNSSNIHTTAAPMSSCTTITTSAINSICSAFAPIQPKEEVKSTPPNCAVPNPKARSASTPSRKASHIRILNFHTPAKQSPLAAGAITRIATPGSAPASVDHRSSRTFLPPRLPQLDSIEETSLVQQESTPTFVKLEGDWDSVHGIGAITSDPPLNSNPSHSNTPRVARDPRSCVRVLSRSASENGDEAKSPPPPAPVISEAFPATPASLVMVEIPASEVRKKLTPPGPISEEDMEEWRRIRAVSKSNFDQHLRLVEEQRQQHGRWTSARKKRKKPKKKPQASTNEGINESADTTLEKDSSLTEEHAQMLEEALASAKKVAVKTPAKTPAKSKASPKDPDEQPQSSKIYVKITTPKKKTPAKASPRKRRLSRSGKSAKKKKSSAKKKLVQKKESKEEQDEVPEQETEPSEEVENPKLESPKVDKDPTPEPESPKAENEPEPEPEPPKDEKDAIPEVLVSPPEPPKPVKDHPKLLAKKSSAEYIRKEQEQQQQQLLLMESPGPLLASPVEDKPKDPPFPISGDCSLNASLLLETPFKTDPGIFPITPRFLVPNQVQDTPISKIMRDLKGTDAAALSSSITKACEIQTPTFPITPGLISTPKSINSVSPQSNTGGGFSSRRTDYSSGSSYYKPDESEDLDKNLEAMLHGERRRRLPEPVLEPAEIQAPPGEEEPPLQEEISDEPPPEEQPTPDEPADPVDPSDVSSSSSSSSSSSDSSSDSSSEASSPENTPVKDDPSTEIPDSPRPLANIYETRRQQQAELEAKKQRTIARMKNTNPPAPKRVERKFAGAPGFKTRKVVITRKEQVLKKLSSNPGNSSSHRLPLTSKPSSSFPPSSRSISKRKNPTPRKVVYLDKVLPPVTTKKHSPKRKPFHPPPTPTTMKTRRASLTITNQDVPKIATPRKVDQLIEGTYENENLTRLCFTPDQDPAGSETEQPPRKTQTYAFQSPDRGAGAEKIERPQANEATPDSNKENQSMESVKSERVVEAPSDEEEDDSEEDESEDEWTLNAFGEDVGSGCFFQYVYDDKKTAASSTLPENRIIKKCNVVLDGRKICLQSQEVISLLEHQPKKAGSSSPKKESKAVKTSSKVKSKPAVSSIAAAGTKERAPSPAVKAKFHVVSAMRTNANPITGKKARIQAQHPRSVLLVGQQKRPQEVASRPTKTKEVLRPENGASGPAEKVAQCVSPSPKMPLKLDMKKKQQQQQHNQQVRSATTKVMDRATPPLLPPPPPEAAAPLPEEEEAQETSPQLHVYEDEIAAVLSHLHGS